MSVRISSVSNISPKFGRSSSPIRDSFITRMVERSSDSPSAANPNLSNPMSNHTISQHMDTDASRKALYKLLTKQKSRDDNEKVA